MRDLLIAWLWPKLVPHLEKLIVDVLRKQRDYGAAEKPARAHFGRKP